MAIIIPSKHIYKKENNKVVNNAISAIDQNISNVTVEYGNILSMNYTFRFYEYGESGLSEIYSDKRNTGGFDFTESTNSDGDKVLNSVLKLNVNKNAKVLISNGFLASHEVKYRRTYLLKKTDTSTQEVYYSRNEFTTYRAAVVSSYDQATGILEISTSRIVAYADENMFLESEGFEIVGEYIVQSPTKISYGSGTNVFSLPTNELAQSNSIITNAMGFGTITDRVGGDKSSNVERLEIFTQIELPIGAKIVYQNEIATVGDLFYEDESGKWYGIYTKWDSLFYQSRGNQIDFSIANEISFSSYLAEYILSKYKNGRETAKLKCGIADYFDESGNKVVSTTNNIIIPYNGEVSVYLVDDYTIKAEIRLEPDEEQDKDVTLEIIIEETDGSYIEKIYIQKYTTDFVYEAQGKVLSVELKSAYVEKLKMAFSIGDEVVPYFRSASATDLPLSMDDSGNAKTFKVTAVEFIYDGAVWQELTLIEHGIQDFYTYYFKESNVANGDTYLIFSNQISSNTNTSNGTTYIIGVQNGG